MTLLADIVLQHRAGTKAQGVGLPKWDATGTWQRCQVEGQDHQQRDRQQDQCLRRWTVLSSDPVRTGFASLTGATPGNGNCDAWSSDDGADSGTVVHMVSDWTGGGEDVGPWNAKVRTWDHGFRVWCVQDHRHFRVYLPLMSKG